MAASAPMAMESDPGDPLSRQTVYFMAIFFKKNSPLKPVRFRFLYRNYKSLVLLSFLFLYFFMGPNVFDFWRTRVSVSGYGDVFK